MSGTATISELALTLLQAYMLAAKAAGLTEEEAKETFNKTVTGFMVVSSTPIDEVKD